jgi:predicted nucleic acid-binding protein
VLSAVDTNVISALWSREAAAAGMETLLFEAKQAGGLVICAPVYCELRAYPGVDRAFMQRFLNDTGIRLEHDIGMDVWEAAAFAAYAELRRKDRAGQPKRLLADFVIGAHALLKADRLLSLDAGRYSAFPDLRVVGRG